MKEPTPKSNLENGPINNYEQYLLETKKFHDFGDSLLAQMPGGKFDLTSAEHWEGFADIINGIYQKTEPKRQILLEKGLNKDAEELEMKHYLGGSLLHKKREDIEQYLVNQGFFNLLCDKGILDVTDRTLFLSIMPDYNIQFMFDLQWVLKGVNISKELKQRVYEEKMTSFDTLSEKTGGFEVWEKPLREFVNWLQKALKYQGYLEAVNNGMTVEQLNTMGYSEWGSDSPKPTAEFLRALGKCIHLESLNINHGLSKYFGTLAGTEPIRLRPDPNSEYFK